MMEGGWSGTRARTKRLSFWVRNSLLADPSEYDEYDDDGSGGVDDRQGGRYEDGDGHVGGGKGPRENTSPVGVVGVVARRWRLAGRVGPTAATRNSPGKGRDEGRGVSDGAGVDGGTGDFEGGSAASSPSASKRDASGGGGGGDASSAASSSSVYLTGREEEEEEDSDVNEEGEAQRSEHDSIDWIRRPGNIDEALSCLYDGTSDMAMSAMTASPLAPLGETEAELFLNNYLEQHDYDWLLDGEEGSAAAGGPPPRAPRQRPPPPPQSGGVFRVRGGDDVPPSSMNSEDMMCAVLNKMSLEEQLSAVADNDDHGGGASDGGQTEEEARGTTMDVDVDAIGDGDGDFDAMEGLDVRSPVAGNGPDADADAVVDDGHECRPSPCREVLVVDRYPPDGVDVGDGNGPNNRRRSPSVEEESLSMSMSQSLPRPPPRRRRRNGTGKSGRGDRLIGGTGAVGWRYRGQSSWEDSPTMVLLNRRCTTREDGPFRNDALATALPVPDGSADLLGRFTRRGQLRVIGRLERMARTEEGSAGVGGEVHGDDDDDDDHGDGKSEESGENGSVDGDADDDRGVVDASTSSSSEFGEFQGYDAAPVPAEEVGGGKVDDDDITESVLDDDEDAMGIDDHRDYYDDYEDYDDDYDEDDDDGGELPTGYYIEDFDPVASLLEDAPQWSSGRDTRALDEHLTAELSRADELRTSIDSRLVRCVKRRHLQISHGMARLHDVEEQVRNSMLHALSARHRLETARHNAALDVSMKILRESSARDRLGGLGEALGLVTEVLDLEEALMSFHGDCAGGEKREGDGVVLENCRPHAEEEYYDEMVRVALLFKERATALRGLDCFLDLTARARTAMAGVNAFLNGRLAGLLRASCCPRPCGNDERDERGEGAMDQIGFSSKEYATLLKVRLKLDAHLIAESDPNLKQESEAAGSLGVGTTCSGTSVSGIGSQWSGTILSFLRNEADHCLARALPLLLVQDDGAERDGIENDSDQGGHEGLLRAFHALCMSLADVLHTHYLVTQWHRSPFDRRNEDVAFLHRCPCVVDADCAAVDESGTIAKSDSLVCASTDDGDDESAEAKKLSLILTELRLTRMQLWSHCQALMERLIESHLVSQADQKNSSPSATPKSSSSAATLRNLKNILRIEERMEGLVKEFCGPTAEVDPNNFFGDVRAKLSEVFRCYFRSCHTESISEVGTMLLSESWHLIPMEIGTVDRCEALSKLLIDMAPVFQPDEYDDTQWDCGSEIGFEHFTRSNPFLLSENDTVHCASQKSNGTSHCPLEQEPQLKLAIAPVLEPYCDETKCFVATQTAMNGLARWTARYLQTLKMLPMIEEEISAGISRLFDVYFLTVLRLCAGNSSNEKLLIDMNSSSTAASVADRGGRSSPVSGRASPATTFNTGRSNGGKVVNRLQPTKRYVSAAVEAEMCAPLPSELRRFSVVRGFVARGREGLEDDGIINLDNVSQWIPDEDGIGPLASAFERRFAAAKSCAFAAALLEVASVHARHLNEYCASVVKAIPPLVALTERMAAVRAIGGKDIVNEVVDIGVGWEEAELGHGSNPYVEDLCDRCAGLWGSFSSGEHPLLPRELLSSAWENIVSGVYVSLLEGFSKISICSTEGRALMSMDLASFAEGVSPRSIDQKLSDLDSVPTPPSIRPSRGMQYADIYVKVFYYGDEEIMKWMEENSESYRLRHALALVSCAVASRSASGDRNKGQVARMVERIKVLYLGHVT